MIRNKALEKTPLLKTIRHTNYNGIDNSHISINNSDSSSTESIIDLRSLDEIRSVKKNDSLNNLLLDSDSSSFVINLETDWIDTVDRYGGKTKKRKDFNGDWKYETKIFDNFGILETKVYEKLININNQLYSMKEIRLNNGKLILELSNLDNSKQLQQKYKIYQNEQTYYNDLQSLDLESFRNIYPKLNWYETISIWSNNILHDSKKVLQGMGYLTIVIGIRTIQRAFTVIVSGDDEMDWNKLLKTINPTENPIEFGLTLPQLLISVLAMDVWKWGVTNIINEIYNLRTIDYSQPDNTEIVNNNNSNYFKSIIKIFGTKLGYWLPNHLMITCSSMYSVKSLTSMSAYLCKLKSGWNILSTFIRAEALWFISGFLKDGLAKFGETHIYTSFKNYIINLFKREYNLPSLFKIAACSTVMIGATVGDNALKTAVVMWTADKLDEFVPTFFTWEMGLIMLGLISVDTFGNKYCNVKAKQELSKLWNDLKSNCFDNNTNNQSITTDDDEEFHDALDNETKLLEQKVTIETQNKNISDLIKRYNLNEEEFHDALDNQQWDVNEIKKQTEIHSNQNDLQNQPSTSTRYHSI